MHTLMLTHLHDMHESIRQGIDGLGSQNKCSWCAYEFLLADYIAYSLFLLETAQSCEPWPMHSLEEDVHRAYEGVDRVAAASPVRA